MAPRGAGDRARAQARVRGVSNSSGWENYQDWYENGAGSENWKRNMRKASKEWYATRQDEIRSRLLKIPKMYKEPSDIDKEFDKLLEGL